MGPGDRSYVISSWLRSLEYGTRGRYDYEPGEPQWYRDHEGIVCGLVDRSSVVIAGTPGTDIIVGWYAAEDDALHYVHVKERWRRLGIARWMLAEYADMPVVYTHATHVVTRRDIVPAGWKYRPARTWLKEAET